MGNNNVQGALEGRDKRLCNARFVVPSAVLVYNTSTKRLALRRSKQDRLVRLREPATSASSGFNGNRTVMDFHGF